MALLGRAHMLPNMYYLLFYVVPAAKPLGPVTCATLLEYGGRQDAVMYMRHVYEERSTDDKIIAGKLGGAFAYRVWQTTPEGPDMHEEQHVYVDLVGMSATGDIIEWLTVLPEVEDEETDG